MKIISAILKRRWRLSLRYLAYTTLGAFCFGAGGAQAADTAVPTSTPLRVGVTPVLPPMVFKQGRDLVGVDVDLAQALGQHLRRPVQFVEVPWADQIQALIDGRTDIIMSSLSITAARRFVINFSDPYLNISQVALVRRVDRHKYDLGFPFQLPGPVGVIKGTTGDFLVQREYPKAKRKEYSTGAEATKALINKKVDLFVSDSPLVWYLAGIHATEGLAAVPVSLSDEPLGWGVRKSDGELLQSANQFLAQARKDGSLRRIIQRWLPTTN
jgi:polar amino acid transport system substrate-binding protein